MDIQFGEVASRPRKMGGKFLVAASRRREGRINNIEYFCPQHLLEGASAAEEEESSSTSDGESSSSGE